MLLTAPHGEQWEFGPPQQTSNRISGEALNFCLVAARRLDPEAADLRAEGPESATVLSLLRTYG